MLAHFTLQRKGIAGGSSPAPPGKVKDVGNCQKRCVAQVTVLEEPVRRKYVRGSNAEVKERLVRSSPATGAESPGLSPETFAVGRFILRN